MLNLTQEKFASFYEVCKENLFNESPETLAKSNLTEKYKILQNELEKINPNMELFIKTKQTMIFNYPSFKKFIKKKYQKLSDKIENIIVVHCELILTSNSGNFRDSAFITLLYDYMNQQEINPDWNLVKFYPGNKTPDLFINDSIIDYNDIKFKFCSLSHSVKKYSLELDYIKIVNPDFKLSDLRVLIFLINPEIIENNSKIKKDLSTVIPEFVFTVLGEYDMKFRIAQIEINSESDYSDSELISFFPYKDLKKIANREFHSKKCLMCDYSENNKNLLKISETSDELIKHEFLFPGFYCKDCLSIMINSENSIQESADF